MIAESHFNVAEKLFFKLNGIEANGVYTNRHLKWFQMEWSKMAQTNRGGNFFFFFTLQIVQTQCSYVKVYTFNQNIAQTL